MQNFYDYIESVDTAFELKPSLSSLVKAKFKSTPKGALKLAVFRNHTIEHFAEPLQQYAKFCGLEVQLDISDYDDSFSFSNDVTAYDAAVLWVDTAHFNLDDAQKSEWLHERIAALRSQSQKPIIVVPLGFSEAIKVETPGVFLLDPMVECATVAPVLDRQREKVFGTALTISAGVCLMRALCFKLLAGLFTPLKALIVDLDHTLYAGVLGEDGIQGVELTPQHKALQEHVKLLADAGILVGVASKNEYADVQALFEQRSDFPLAWDDFSIVKANWAPKSENITEIINFWRIGDDTVLFLDDNLGELVEVQQALPALHVLPAKSAAFSTNALKLYPGLNRLVVTAEDVLRKADLTSSVERTELAKTAVSAAEYLKNIQVQLSFYADDKTQLHRCAEISQKTNQFNFLFGRLTEDALRHAMESGDSCVVTAGLRDRLSDSGLIFLMVAQKQANETLKVAELAMSCRALGRKVEGMIVEQALTLAAEKLSLIKPTIEFDFKTAPRNKPAFEFLATYLDKTLPQQNEGQLSHFSISWDDMPTFDKSIVQIDMHN